MRLVLLDLKHQDAAKFPIVLCPCLAMADSCTVLQGFVSHGNVPKVQSVEAHWSVSHVLGAGLSEDCFWRFSFRSDFAHNLFERLQKEMRACSVGPLTVETTGVNHPDSFDQTTGELRGVSISLSLKDKGGLSETLVVLRRQLP